MGKFQIFMCSKKLLRWLQLVAKVAMNCPEADAGVFKIELAP
jgi:hypothetical protein